MWSKIKPFLAEERLFFSLVLVLVAAASFVLGRSSIRPSTAEVVFETSPLLETSSVIDETGGPASTDSTSVAEIEVIGSKNGTKYHYSWCAGAKQIKPENQIVFPNQAAALAAGYTLAANCQEL